MKHAVIYTVTGTYVADQLAEADLSTYHCEPPTGQQWSTWGLKPGEDFDPKHFQIERHERVLPSAVINREAEVRFAVYEDQTGRKPGKKARAEIKGQVVDDLLPKAFVRVTHIPVTIANGLLIIWTSSIPKADHVASLIVGMLSHLGIPAKIEFKPLKPGLEVIALGKHDTLQPGNSAVLSGADKQKVRVKALPVESHRVQPLIEVDGYSVNEIEVRLDDDSCTLTDKGIVKAMNLMAGDSEDEAGVWLALNFIKRLVDTVDEDEL